MLEKDEEELPQEILSLMPVFIARNLNRALKSKSSGEVRKFSGSAPKELCALSRGQSTFQSSHTLSPSSPSLICSCAARGSVRGGG